MPLRREWLTGALPNRKAEVLYLFLSLFPGAPPPPREGRGGEKEGPHRVMQSEAEGAPAWPCPASERFFQGAVRCGQTSYAKASLPENL